MLSSLRRKVQPIGRLVARPFVLAGISPNAITLAAVPLSTLAGLALAKGYFFPALALAVPAVLLDFLDGAVARASGQVSDYGNHLEAVVDRYVEAALLAGLSAHFPVLATAALGFSMLVSYIKARVGLVIASDNSDWPGVGGRADRMLLLLLVLLFLAYGYQTAGLFSLGLLTAVAAVGSFQRLRHSKLLIEEAATGGE
ncbi:MAG: CDP-alcohol phosphatidyltransferase family protein [Vulcanimicrobiota bacterium]